MFSCKDSRLDEIKFGFVLACISVLTYLTQKQDCKENLSSQTPISTS